MENPLNRLKLPKWPFLLGEILLLALAYFVVCRSPHPISQWEILACLAVAALGAVIGCAPFILDYRAAGKLIEINALGAVAEKIQNLEKLAAQIAAATGEWMNVQTQAEKTSNNAREISDKMAAEVREFSAFMQKMNDAEKTALRLEAGKFRRAETEWLQTLVRILDHIFALHAAAVRTGDAKFIEPIAQFQNACRDAARRVGLAPFVAAPDEPFHPERHQTAGDEKPPATAAVAQTIGAGYTFQGKLLRPALVKLRDENPAATKNEDEQLALESPD